MSQKPEQDRAERVRRRAHDIWERDGRPDGRHDEHWAQAEAEVDDEIRAERQSAETESSAPEAPPKRRSTKAPAAKPASAKPKATPKAAPGSGTRAAAENLSAVAAGRTEQTGTTKTGGQISRGGAASGKPGKASRRDASRG
ncbi:DUF2934 domain-containing protein [Azospirillum brasilense]|uniref:DUF2934 domain-containing protein n=1 Tax=Azospirillum brasilense TaxID=192 RepID=A0A0P0EDP9_AZOBR|nr:MULTISPECIES: DUF2934 domain-containing protein [Azospirillum]ALJ37196.1 hypothetical protein AMK58_17025 [Azospirillum brasilense]MDW7551902.1 DUF2934 domain-containing protein [Azospirillum brasilense]MDW7591337.1 DUF2934 domain-containing protein [Azospirillum brasilense]MDW7626507.1 DUF2934 domain-containing protein [Azospirillum brasilense]MDX5951144.1 DUF2934 domain-containing protein [Azospirillum brasilense]